MEPDVNVISRGKDITWKENPAERILRGKDIPWKEKSRGKDIPWKGYYVKV